MKRYLPKETIQAIETCLFVKGKNCELKIENGKICVITIERKLVSKEMPDKE